MMKNFKPQILSLSLILAGCSFPAYAQLLLSQYVDGTSNKKGLEIYNPDPTTVNLAEYQIKQYANGSTSANLTVSLTGQLAAKGHYLVGHSALKEALGDTVQQQANLAFNGDDALVLYHNGVAIDRFGTVGERPSTGWGGIAKGNSFKRTLLSNNVSSTGIDVTAPFDLASTWEKWSDRNAFSSYLAGNTAPPLATVSCSTTATPIAALQSAAQDVEYVVKGVITADYRYNNGFSGFFVQTPDAQAKANTSNAVFVYVPSSSSVTGGQVGQEVIFKGKLKTYQNQLQLQDLSSDINVCNPSASDWVKPMAINLPFDNLTEMSGHAPKRYQGMLVNIPQTLTVSENYNYGRFGELALSPARLYIPTNLYPAHSTEAKELAQQNLRSKLILDDGYNNQNRTPWLPTTFSAKNTLRTGAQLQNVQGILEYRYNQWRIQPVLGATAPQVLDAKNPRATVPEKATQQVRVAAFNVLNYDNGLAQGFPTERGASSEAEFKKQHQKIVSALKAIDADVYGLMEIANNGYGERSAVAYLAQALGSDWKYVTPPNADKLGTDAIAVAIIYNAKRVKPINVAAVFDDQSQKNRVTMAQTFQALSGGKTFTVIPNHLKSKGSCPDDKTSIEADQGDGQGCWNPTRVKAVQALMQWVAKNPTQVSKPNVLLLGDLNSYAKEDPILALEQANYKVLLNDEKIGQGKAAYSYVFGVASNAQGYGGAGNLDHAIADVALYPLVKKAFAWHINADEPTALDYNEEYKTEEQIAAFYADDAYRSSDHDPVIVDLDLNDAVVNDDDKTHAGSTGLWSALGLISLALYGSLRRRKNQS